LVKRVKSGIEGLDEVIEGGFPSGSLILLAGEPGTGKTVFSIQFLVKGAELNEPGVYVSFAEAKNTLIENFSRHLGVDLAKLEIEGKIKILDFTAMKEEGIPTILESILTEVKTLNAKRLVIDSFSALAQAFKDPTDVRIVVHTVLSRIVRGMNCTTVMVEEVPIGRANISLGIEEFVTDSVLRLRVDELDKRLLRNLEIVKLRGTKVNERKLVFTLEGGFKTFPPFKPKPIEKPSRFQPIQDKPDKYSTGVKDLDIILEGGLSKGSIVLLELDEKVSMLEYHLIVVPIIMNSITQGRAVLIIPTLGVDAEVARRVGLGYGLTDNEINNLLRVCEAHDLSITSSKPYIVMFKAKDPWKDYSKYLEIEKELMQTTGQPVIHVSGADTLASYYGECICRDLLGRCAKLIREHRSFGIILLKPGYPKLKETLPSIASIYLRLLREHGCLLLYGIKPRTCLHAVEMDVSKGYPLPKLTPIV
jgi:KaiC/GvpD/RAD55 family RecA-like ATPase